jgi:hypothetical protein
MSGPFVFIEEKIFAGRKAFFWKGQAVEKTVAVTELAVDISGDDADVAVADTFNPAHIAPR